MTLVEQLGGACGQFIVTFKNFERARAIAKRRGRIRAIELSSELEVGLNEAIGIVERLEQHKFIGPADFSDWHGSLEQDDARVYAPRATPDLPVRDDPLIRIAELETRVSRLIEAGRTVISQRNAWEARALAAEAREGPIGGTADNRFSRLKRLIAVEFHPDQSQGEGIDRLVREAIFKRLWPLVEDIEKHALKPE